MAPGFTFISKTSPSTAGKRSIKAVLSRETDAFWHPAMTIPPPPNYTPGLIPILKSRLTESRSRGEIRKAVLCYDQAVFIQRQVWDAGWGCGYRNFLMACAVLMVQPFEPVYFPLIDEPIPPGIRNLQQWIEIAWDAGFDAEGKKQLKKLLGSNKWIGTSDLWVAFSSRGVPVELVDFDISKQNGVQPLIDWVVKYFTPQVEPNDSPRSALDAIKLSNAVVTTELMPLILQHPGHSRLIVGYEIDKRGKVNFLIFDCASSVPKDLRAYALSKLSVSETPPEKKKLKRQASGPLSSSGGIKRSRSDSYPGGSDEVIEIVGEHNMDPSHSEHLDDDIVITGFFSPKTQPASSSTPSSSRGNEKQSEWKGDIDLFRLSQKKLGRHDHERFKRRNPTSTKAC